MSPTKKAYWLLVAVTLGVYFTMVSWSLPYISNQAGGLLAFDMRPFGYSFEQAKDFLGQLSPAGVEFYTRTQHMLDMVFPALGAMAVAIPTYVLLRKKSRGLAMTVPLVAVAGAVFDYVENAAVAGMLQAGADGVTVEQVAFASQMTTFKSASVSISTIILIGLLLGRLVARLRAGRGTGDGS